AHRSAPQDPGDVAALRARHGCGGNPQHLLPQGDVQAAEGRLARAVRFQPLPRLQGDQRSGRRRHRQGRVGGWQEAHRAASAPARREGPKALRMTDQELVGHYIGEDLVNPKTGEIYAEAGEEITEKTLKAINEAGYKELPLLDIDHVNVGAY